MSLPRVTQLWIYPIKSCRGIQVPELKIDQFGPQYDRQWMIVDESNQFVTLRNQSLLALVKTKIENKFLIITFDNLEFKVPLDQECSKTEMVTVWSDTFLAGVESVEINTALSHFLNQKVKLVRYQKESFRDLKLAATEFVKQTRFADSRPILLTNENSLADLNDRLTNLNLPISFMERFRSNIVISGLQAFKEDEAMSMTINDVQFKHPKLCARCPVVTQDVDSGKVISKETLIVLSGYRRLAGNKVMFGVNWTPANSGIVRVGDVIEILSTNPF